MTELAGNIEGDDDIFTQDEMLEKEREQAAMESEIDMTVCPSCKGEGITLVASDDDENDRDFDTCTICGGSGELEGENNEEEWTRLGGKLDEPED